MSVHHDGVAVVTRLGGMRFALVGVMLTALALVAALPSITAAGVVQILAALLVGAAGASAVRVVRGVGHPSRGAWIAIAIMIWAIAGASAASGLSTALSGADRVHPVPIDWMWAACGIASICAAAVGVRVLRPARGWQEALDGLLIVVVVTMAILYVNGASPLSTGLPDGIEIIVIVVAVISNASLVLTVGGLIANREGIVGPVLAIATAGIATAYVVLVNLMAPVSPVGVGAAAAVTVLTAWLWVAAAHLRLRRHRTVQIVPRKHRPSMWRELLPAVLLSALVMLVFFTGGVGSLIGALVAAGLVAARMTLTLIQYRRLLDEEHARLAAHERTLIEERYTRFAMEETQSELVEDNERLRGQESDRLGVIQLLQESVLVPTRELRSELARIGDDSDAEPRIPAERVTRMCTRTDDVLRALDDLLTYSLIVERRLTLRRSPVEVDRLVLGIIRDLDDVIERTGVGVQIDGDTSCHINVDPGLISQVVRRLIESALTVSVRGCSVTVLLRASDDVIVIEVSDRGPGFAADDLPYLFIPFYRPRTRTREVPGDVGLALANAKSIVTMHGGAIRVASPARGGAQIRLSLPVDVTSSGAGPRSRSTRRSFHAVDVSA